MECKYIYAHDVGCKNLELIDTLWNVNKREREDLIWIE